MGTTRKILVVGARSEVYDELSAHLRGGGYAVVRASSFEFPFAVAREQPDLALVDFADPTLPVSVLAQLVKEGQARCPIVLIAEASDAERAERATASTVLNHVTLSPGYAGLLESLETMLPREEEPSGAIHAVEPMEFAAIARRSTRSEFATAWPFPFLVSAPTHLSSSNERTLGLLEMSNSDVAPLPARLRSKAKPRELAPMAWPIRKKGGPPAEGITVGRTLDNDVTIDHHRVSRHHAVFRGSGMRLLIADVGSHNGTWVSGQLLVPKGSPSPILSAGDGIRFGDLDVMFTTPAGCWDILRVNVR